MATTAPQEPLTAPHHEHRPLTAYGGFAAAFGTALTGTIVGLHASGRDLPERPAAADLVLAGIATHKIARLITRDKISSFIRAPFTELEIDPEEGEPVGERAVGDGARRALGELLTCPYCLSQWLSAAFATGLVAAPRTTRFVAGIYTIESIADFLQHAHKAAKNRA